MVLLKYRMLHAVVSDENTCKKDWKSEYCRRLYAYNEKAYNQC